MGKLTTHVLDTAHGRPAAGMTISLHRSNDSAPLLTVRTNTDGRCDSPLLQGDACVPGEYELHFVVDRYFAGLGVNSPFLTTVEVRFTISDSNAHYHVPLLVSPYGYTTYRGS